MQPITQILVPIDFSSQSEAALQYAVDLAKRYGASLHLLHAYQVPSYALPGAYIVPDKNEMARLVNGLKLQLEAAKRDALAEGATSVEATLLPGGAALTILDFARERAFDLIVMGTHGRTGLKHLLIGSTAESVVRTAPCPVFTVRSPAEAPNVEAA